MSHDQQNPGSEANKEGSPMLRDVGRAASDLAQVFDRLFDHAREAGRVPGTFIFDRRFVMPLDEAAWRLSAGETAQPVTVSDLETLAARGWFTIANGEDGTSGMHFYVPERIPMFSELASRGYSDDELRVIATHEEASITAFMDLPEFRYLDDDREELLRFHRDRVEGFNAMNFSASSPELTAEYREKMKVQNEQDQRVIAYLEKVPSLPRSPERVERLARGAYRVRMINELLRVSLLEETRSQVRQAFSPFIAFDSFKCTWPKETNGFEYEFGRIDWRRSLRDPWLSELSESVPLRTPWFVLHGRTIVLSQPMHPDDYSRAWERCDIAGYFDAYDEVAKLGACAGCGKVLGRTRKLYCSDRCRNTAKQRRYRERNPESFYAAQARYWSDTDAE